MLPFIIVPMLVCLFIASIAAIPLIIIRIIVAIIDFIKDKNEQL